MAAEELEKLRSQRNMVQAEQQLASEIAGLEKEVQLKSGELTGAPLALDNILFESCCSPQCVGLVYLPRLCMWALGLGCCKCGPKYMLQ